MNHVMRTALVTGANRGLGRETARQLGDRGYRVMATSRDGVGHEQLDVTSDASVAALAKRLAGTTLDVLVNNAGIALDGFNEDVARRTIDTNYFGAVRVTTALLPLLAPRANVVMVSSGLGELSNVSPALRKKFLDPSLDRATLDAMMRGFVDAVAEGTHRSLGWPSSAYSVSKVGLNALTRVLAREHPNFKINAVCPGWVRTDMGGRSAPRDVREGAASIMFAATLPDDGPTGGFFRDGHRVGW